MIQKIFYYLRIYGPGRFIWYLLIEAQRLVKMALQNSYTPFGEDIIIDKLLKAKKGGFYVDVGAYDPTRFSITKRFYLRGWNGINIEPNPEGIKKFTKERSRDINLNIGIADKNGVLDFFRFEPESLSTFSKKEARRYQKQGYKLIETLTIEVYKLGVVLTKYHNGKSIDFFNIDTEGSDYEVLKSNNWNKFRPRVICLEVPSLQDPNYNNPKRKLPHSTERLLAKLGYKKVGKTISNLIFQDSNN